MDCSMMENNLALPMTLPKLISTIDTVHQTFQTRALQSVSVNLTLYVPTDKLLRTCSFSHFIELKRQVESLLYERVGLSIYNNAMLNGECLILNEKRVA